MILSVFFSNWSTAPAAFAFADQSSPVCRADISGPVISVLTFDNDEEAQALANDRDYGLFVSLWTQSGANTGGHARSGQCHRPHCGKARPARRC
ncbi:MAG TPA: aldehyde dehydrogenase family protein [Candidatus Latescibacteria bacterium]|nr:aldehyde dehydrogenase family protein [Candidatus Handelsmanbacteria bacterium]HIL08085.1 aldehyde dehydrogenase family protein [Candidatus Latescibacterota bacterium]